MGEIEHAFASERQKLETIEDRLELDREIKALVKHEGYSSLKQELLVYISQLRSEYDKKYKLITKLHESVRTMKHGQKLKRDIRLAYDKQKLIQMENQQKEEFEDEITKK